MTIRLDGPRSPSAAPALSTTLKQGGVSVDPSPWDPLDLPWDEMPDTRAIPRDREIRPSRDEVLALRRDRMATVRTVIDTLTGVSLAIHTEPVEGPAGHRRRASRCGSVC